MKCDFCNKPLNVENAFHCPDCGKNCCRACYERNRICSCYSDMVLYS